MEIKEEDIEKYFDAIDGTYLQIKIGMRGFDELKKQILDNQEVLEKMTALISNPNVTDYWFRLETECIMKSILENKND